VCDAFLLDHVDDRFDSLYRIAWLLAVHSLEGAGHLRSNLLIHLNVGLHKDWVRPSQEIRSEVTWLNEKSFHPGWLQFATKSIDVNCGETPVSLAPYNIDRGYQSYASHTSESSLRGAVKSHRRRAGPSSDGTHKDNGTALLLPEVRKESARSVHCTPHVGSKLPVPVLQSICLER